MKTNNLYSLLKKENIEIEKDLYDYGIATIKSYLLFLILSFFCAFLIDTLTELVLFYLVFIPLRRNLGGFHFNSKTVCFVFSILIALICSLFIKYLNLNSILLIILNYFFVFLVTYYLGCVDHPNKPLNTHEKEYFKHKAFYIELCFFGLSLISHYFNWTVLINVLIIVPILCIIGNLLAYKKNITVVLKR